jgi:intracellular septation protein
MKFFFDLFPVILFFAAFKYAGRHSEQAAAWLGQWLGIVPAEQAPILLATMVVILATMAQIAYARLRHGRVEKMLLFSLVLVVLLGGLTLVLRDATFIKWKPTLLYWAIAASMTVAALFRRNAMRLMLSGNLQFSLPEFVWLRLNLAWIVFFLAMGGLNLFVAFRYTIETWVDFKLFGMMALFFLFALGQGMYLSRYMKEEPEEGGEEEKEEGKEA